MGAEGEVKDPMEGNVTKRRKARPKSASHKTQAASSLTPPSPTAKKASTPASPPAPPRHPLTMQDEPVRVAVTDLIATNNRLRRAVVNRDAEIASLKVEIDNLKKDLTEADQLREQQAEDLENVRLQMEQAKKQQIRRGSSSIVKRKHHPLDPEANMVNGDLSIHKVHLARQASIATTDALQSLQTFQANDLAAAFLELYRDPTASVDYLASDDFAFDIIRLCELAKHVFEAESRCLFLESPCYVFGDTHGNLEDLHFFSDNIWRLGMGLSAGRFLFLGDYVDRGLSSLEVVTYLIALKIIHPTKVFMLRGNHETRDVNGWEEHYGDRSFIAQCKSRFGDERGEEVWEELNQVFDRLPLAAVIDQDVFCIHGGIPRPLPGSSPNSSRLEMIMRVPPISGINPPYDHEEEHLRQLASECIWSDPAGEDQEESGELGPDGFGESPRGGGTICFGNKAIDDFLADHQLSYVMRAHEAHAYGVAMSKRARCFTVFSTSKDHNQGSRALCGCVLVDFEKMEVITRSPHYQNMYVHRRDSLSVAQLHPDEYEARERVGLITEVEDDSDEYDEYDEYDDEYDEYYDEAGHDPNMQQNP